MATIKKTQHCEILILGADLTGLALAEWHHQQGRQVEVFEANSQWMHQVLVNPEVDFVPGLPVAGERLQWLAQLLQAEVQFATEESGPVHFDEGHMRPFVGFGERKFASREEIDFYSTPQRLVSQPDIRHFAKLLVERWQERVLSPREATRIWAENKRISGIEFNGEEVWTANQVVSTLAPRTMLALLPIESLDGRSRTRLAKAHVWASVSLHLKHAKPQSMERGIHILYGSGQEFEPIVGRFDAVNEDGSQISVWTTLVSQELSDDSDQLGHALKHIKRQVKRAYHTAFDDLADEKVIVTPESHGHLAMKSADTFGFPELANLTLATPLLSPYRGFLAEVDVAARLSQSLPATPHVDAQASEAEANP